MYIVSWVQVPYLLISISLLSCVTVVLISFLTVCAFGYTYLRETYGNHPLLCFRLSILKLHWCCIKS